MGINMEECKVKTKKCTCNSETKLCPKCNKVKLRAEFYTAAMGKLGLSSYCIECSLEKARLQRIARLANPGQVPQQDTLKQCANCEEVKPVSEFGRHKYCRDGLNPSCKTCVNVKGLVYKRKTRPKRVVEILPAGLRRCTKCKEVKPNSEFNKTPCGKNGLSSHCKLCRSKEAKEFRKANPEHAKAVSERQRQKPDYKAKQRRRYLANLEENRAKRRAYHHNNKAKIRAYKEKNAEHIRERDRQYRQAHPDIWQAKKDAYLARFNAAEGSFTPKEWQNKCAEYNFCCAYCGEKTFLTKQHVIPLSKGGSNFISNIVPACRSCNSRIRDSIVYPPTDPNSIPMEFCHNYKAKV